MNIATATKAQIHGTVTAGYERVRDAFAKNFERAGEDAEVGAGLCVYVNGKQVVDLWGGFADAALRVATLAPDKVNSVYALTPVSPGGTPLDAETYETFRSAYPNHGAILRQLAPHLTDDQLDSYFRRTQGSKDQTIDASPAADEPDQPRTNNKQQTDSDGPATDQT